MLFPTNIKMAINNSLQKLLFIQLIEFASALIVLYTSLKTSLDRIVGAMVIELASWVRPRSGKTTD